MKLTLQKVWDSQQAFPKLAGKDLPLKVAYWIGRNVAKLQSELKSLNDSRVSLVKKYGAEDDKRVWNVKPENYGKFNEEFSALLATECDIDIKQFSFDDLGDMKMSAQELNAIEFMVKEE
jgi:hypothetical protein